MPGQTPRRAMHTHAHARTRAGTRTRHTHVQYTHVHYIRALSHRPHAHPATRALRVCTHVCACLALRAAYPRPTLPWTCAHDPCC